MMAVQEEPCDRRLATLPRTLTEAANACPSSDQSRTYRRRRWRSRPALHCFLHVQVNRPTGNRSWRQYGSLKCLGKFGCILLVSKAVNDLITGHVPIAEFKSPIADVSLATKCFSAYVTFPTEQFGTDRDAEGPPKVYFRVARPNRLSAHTQAPHHSPRMFLFCSQLLAQSSGDQRGCQQHLLHNLPMIV